MKHGMEQPQQVQQVQQEMQDGCVSVSVDLEAEGNDISLVIDEREREGQVVDSVDTPLAVDGLTNLDVLLTHLDAYTLSKMTVKLVCINGIEHYYCTTPGQLFPMSQQGLDDAIAFERAYWESIAPAQDQPT